MPDLNENETSVWIKTGPTLDGKSFMVEVEIDKDTSIVLDRTNCLEYGYAILSAVAHAEYDAAVMKQLTSKLEIKPEDALQVVLDMRQDRAPINMAATSPLALVPGVNKELKPFLTVKVHDEAVGQWTLKDAREHALAAIEAHIVADLDTSYLKELKGLIGLEDHVARNVIEDLEKWR